MGRMRRVRPFVGRAKPTGLADSSHSRAYGDRPDRQPVVARVDHGMIRSQLPLRLVPFGSGFGKLTFEIGDTLLGIG
jgi:hypothetical protein